MAIEIKKDNFRTYTKDLFKISGLFNGNKLKHGFFIVVDSNTGIISLLRNSDDLLELDDNVKIITQWSGEWSSDLFLFTAKQLKEFKKKGEQKDEKE